eukprot:7189454-Prymnesium_polylepis.1
MRRGRVWRRWPGAREARFLGTCTSGRTTPRYSPGFSSSSSACSIADLPSLGGDGGGGPPAAVTWAAATRAASFVTIVDT